MNPDNLPDAEEKRLLDAAANVPLDLPLATPPAPTLFGKILDSVGRYLVWGAAVVAAITLIIGAVGGESLAWVSYFYVIALVALVLYIPYQFRNNRREEFESAKRRLKEQEAARIALVRMILDEKHKNEEK